jgi:SSS family solute:Na+ symporter
MNMAPLDWTILGAVWVVLIVGVLFTKRYMRSVADFLAAGRTAGRYVVSLSQGMAMVGAISVIAFFQQNYVAGFNLSWWRMSEFLIYLLVTVSGWVVYRFRQTRCLTLAEFFERRYGRSFRVFGGLLSYVAGIINFGIFPAVGARFFLVYTGLPESLDVLGGIPTYPFLMFVLLATALFFVFAGGQIAVIVTDFLQAVFVSAVFIVLVAYLVVSVGWTDIAEALTTAPEGQSMVNPFDTGDVEHFDFGFFLIAMVGLVYNAMSWQGEQAYNASAKSAHEAKMGRVLSNWRWVPLHLFLVVIPVVAFTVLNHANFAPQAAEIESVLAATASEEVQSQMRVPLALTKLLPVGLLGAFAAVMLAAFISTHDTYLHSWGSIFIQDVVMPFRKRPFTQRQHLRLLRLSIVGVAIFIFLFSLFFQQNQHISLFLAVTGSIFVGGAGAAIIGGLYWRRGTAGGAWAAMIAGAAVSLTGVILNQVIEDFPLDGQVFWGLAMAASTLMYVVVSLAQNRTFDLDALLHRDDVERAGAEREAAPEPSRVWKLFGMGREFTRGDRAIYIVTYAWTFAWLAVFAFGTVMSFTSDVSDQAWASFWKVYVVVHLGAAAVVLVWFTIGGIGNLRSMFRDLSTMKRDEADDGMIRPEGPNEG